MKTSLILIIASFLAISVMGQSSSQNNDDHASQNLQHLKDYEKYYAKNLKHNMPFIQQNIAAKANFLTSGLATKQKLDSIVSLSWDDYTSKWSRNAKESYTYNNNGKLVMDVMSMWDEPTQLWEDFIKLKMSYDYNGQLTDCIISINFGFWIDLLKMVPVYNAKGMITEAMGYEFDTDLNDWVISNKSVYTYDGKDFLTELLSVNWNSTASAWINNTKVLYNYDANGNNTASLEYSWDTIASIWINANKSNFSFDANTNLIQTINYSWSDYSNQWEYSDKSEFTYNNSYAAADLIIPVINLTANQNQGFRHMITLVNTYNYDGSSWVLDGKNTYHYSSFMTNSIAENINSPDMSVFPNPTTGKITVHFVDPSAENINLAVYNLLGDKIFEQSCINSQNTAEIYLSGHPKGIYILKASIGNKINSEKVVLK